MDGQGTHDAVSNSVPGMSRRVVLRGIGLGSVAAALAAAGWTVETQAQEATPGATPGTTEEPNAIVVLFGQPTDVAAFEEYYLETHRPLALQIPGLQEILGGPILSTLEGGVAEHHRIAILRFAGRADLDAALGSTEGQEAFADVANFATGGVTAYLVRLESVAGLAGAGTPAAATPGA
jgi:uncharacterized protein (TIGR02118 family)